MVQVAGLDLKAFIRALAADAPAPGAGAAGAAALGMAAACAAKAFAVSARHSQSAPLTRAADKAREIALLALAGADWDAEDFPALLKAGGDAGPAEQLERDAEAMLTLAADLKSLIAAHLGAVIPAMAGDLTAAAALVQAFETIEGHNLDELKP